MRLPHPTSLLFAAFAILVVQSDIIVLIQTDRFGYDELSNPRRSERTEVSVNYIIGDDKRNNGS